MYRKFLVRLFITILIFFGIQNSSLEAAETWHNLSRVLDRFGPMTIDGKEISWASGQNAEYIVISKTNEECIIEFTAEELPDFEGLVVQYLKLVVKFTENVGLVTQMEAFFYENKEELSSEKASMWGIYLVPGARKDVHPIAKKMRAAIVKDSSTRGMKEAGLVAIKEWEEEVNRYYELLLEELNGEEAVALKKSQSDWNKYRNSEVEFTSIAYGSLRGSFFDIREIENNIDMLRERTLELKAHYDLILEEKEIMKEN